MLFAVVMDNIRNNEEVFLQQVLSLINDKVYDSKLNFDMFARSLDVSKSTLYRRVTSITGLSPCELILQVKLEKARQLLQDESLYISEIAFRLGFNTPQYFSQCFKNKYGILPKEFRKSQSNCGIQQVKNVNDNSFLKKATTLIENNISSSTYTFNQFAQDMNLSKSTLYRRLKVITGQSPVVYMRSVKLRYAKTLLEVGYGAVYEVALESGFNDAKYFSRCFRMEYGSSPKEYVNMCC